jgi:hypothetical protein
MADATRSDSVDADVAPDRWPRTTRPALVFVGLAMAAVGFVDGVVLMLKRHESSCPNGTYFPHGTTDFRCFTHPDLGEGLAICAIPVMLGVIIFMVGTEPRAK